MNPLTPGQIYPGRCPQRNKWLSTHDGAPLLQMGYANPEQVGEGLLSRLYSRAFIVADPERSKRIVFVSADIGMVSQRLRLEVRAAKEGLAACFLWDFLGVMLCLCCRRALGSSANEAGLCSLCS